MEQNAESALFRCKACGATMAAKATASHDCLGVRTADEPQPTCFCGEDHLTGWCLRGVPLDDTEAFLTNEVEDQGLSGASEGGTDG